MRWWKGLENYTNVTARSEKMSDDERVPEVTPNELVYSLNVMKLGMASGRAVT